MVEAAVVAEFIGAAEVGFASYAGAFAINYAISVQVNRVFGEKPPSQTDQGTRQQIPPNTANALPIAYGDAYLGGTFVDAALTTDQKVMYYVLAVSCISPNGTFTFDQTKMYYGDRLITFGTGPNVASLTDQAGNVDTTIAGNLQIYLYTSSASGVITNVNTVSSPSDVMGSTSGLASGDQWTGTRQMNGLAFAIVRLNYSREAQTTSMQPVTFHVSQYTTGLDRARPGDVWYDYMTNPYYGGAIDPAYIDTASKDALNTYADQLITYTPSGGGTATQRRYKINGVVNAGESVLSNIDKILSASDSWMSYNPPTGKWSIIINKAESTAYSFDDDNIIGELRVSATDITSSVNVVEAKFPNKDNKDQTAYVNLDLAVLNPSLLYPNEPVNKASITLDLVNDNVQASYLSNRILEQAREDLLISFNTTYYGIQVDAGNVISVTNSGYGWTNKLFRVVRVNEISMADGSLGARIDATEYNAAVYGDGNITAFTPVSNSGLPSPVYFSALQAPTVTGYPTASSPTFSVSVYIPITGRVTFGTLFYTTVASPAASDWYQLDFAQTVNSQPVTNSTSGTPVYYTFANEKLAAGTYYFAYVVGNETSQSSLSAMSTAFVWAPVAPTGPTGPTGRTGPTGSGTTGQNGLSSLTAYKVQAQNVTTPSFTTPTSGATAPTGWSLTAPSVAVGQVLWYIQGRYNSGSSTIDGVAAGTTAWTGPVAANVFQDIRSDNWNGSNPPVYGTTGTYGTAGYYIQQSTGDVYFNNGVFRANIDTGGQAKFAGTTSSSFTIPIGGANRNIYYSNWGSFPNAGGAVGGVNAGVFGLSSGFTGTYNVGAIGVGLTEGSVTGIGVVGQGDAIGGYFSTASSSGSALECNNTGGGYALTIDSGTFLYGGTTINVPPASSGYFLRGDGVWASIGALGGGTVTGVYMAANNSVFNIANYDTTPTFSATGGTTGQFLQRTASGMAWASAGSGTVTSVSGTGSVSGLTLSGTVTTSGSLSLGGSLSLTTANLIATAPGAGYYLGGSGWASLNNVMTTAGSNSGTATASSNNINFLGSTSTGIAGAYVGTSASGSTVTFTVQATSPSDARLKEEVQDVDLGLEFVNQLRPVSYKLKADPRHQKGYGFIADEVEQLGVYGSSLVYEEPDWKVGEEIGFKTIHYPSYVAVLTKAIQELSAQIEELKKQIPKI